MTTTPTPICPQPLLGGKWAVRILVGVTLICLTIGVLLKLYDGYESIENKITSAVQGRSLPAKTIMAIPPICADAHDFPIPADREVEEIPMRRECAGGFIQVPLSWPGWQADSSTRGDFLLWFQGQQLPTLIAGGRSTDPETGKEYSFPGHSSFRAMGDGTLIVRRGETAVRMEIREKEKDKEQVH